MKKSILLVLLFSISLFGFSQKYLVKIAEESCVCLENISDTINPEQINMEMGMCIIEAAIPYKKQLLKDHDIDMDQIDVYGEKLGMLIGVKLASVCPNTLLRVTKLGNTVSEEEPEEIDDIQIVNGTVTRIEDDQFVIFSIKDETNRLSKYYWLSGIESDIDITSNYLELLNKDIRIAYETIELFDPRIQVYRQFKVITEIKIGD